MFNPNIQQMNTAIRVQHRAVTNVNGADDINYESETDVSFCNWKGMGGTETAESGTLIVLDTAVLIMWYDASLSEKDRILLNDDENLAYEVINVENIEQRNMFMRVKVKRVVSQ